jgi:hypothetical protein
MEMIQRFATEHRVKVTKDSCDDPVIVGRLGESCIYEYGDGLLGVCFVTDGKKPPRTGIYNTFKATCLKAGMTQRQSGDAEGAFSFKPRNLEQARVALKGIRARFKRRVTPKQAAAGAARLAAARAARHKPHVASEISTKFASIAPRAA